jgi:hypothetical protein
VGLASCCGLVLYRLPVDAEASRKEDDIAKNRKDATKRILERRKKAVTWLCRVGLIGAGLHDGFGDLPMQSHVKEGITQNGRLARQLQTTINVN